MLADKTVFTRTDIKNLKYIQNRKKKPVTYITNKNRLCW